MSQQFLIGAVCIGLAHALARVALALHFAQRSTPLGVTTKDQITKLQVMSVVTNVYFGLALILAQQPKLLHFGNVPNHSLYPKLPLAHPNAILLSIGFNLRLAPSIIGGTQTPACQKLGFRQTPPNRGDENLNVGQTIVWVKVWIPQAFGLACLKIEPNLNFLHVGKVHWACEWRLGLKTVVTHVSIMQKFR